MNVERTFSDRLKATELRHRQHQHGAFGDATLERLEQVLPKRLKNTLETGCGKTTVMFSNLSDHHTVFACDDRDLGDHSSVAFFEKHPLTDQSTIEFVAGPSQRTLPLYQQFRSYDVILLDGPHGFPFVELEYYFTYRHLRNGGFLIIDDVHIPSVGLFADVLKEDEMFEYHALIEHTLVLRRTDAPTYDPFGDGWKNLNYNRRRFATDFPGFDDLNLRDGNMLRPMAEIVNSRIAIERILAPNQSGDAPLREANYIAPEGTAPRFKDWMMNGFSYQFGGKTFVVSGQNILRRFVR